MIAPNVMVRSFGTLFECAIFHVRKTDFNEDYFRINNGCDFSCKVNDGGVHTTCPESNLNVSTVL